MDTKEIIIRTALERFLKYGYDRTSMNEIAKQVGISKPAVYHHFESKQILAESVIDYFEEKAYAWSQRNIMKANTFHDFMRYFIITIPQFYHIENILLDREKTDDFSMGFNDLCMALARDNDNIRQKIDRIFKRTEETKKLLIEQAQREGVIRNDIDAATLALMIHAIIEGLPMIQSFDRESDIDKQVNDIYELLTTLLKPNREDA